MPTLIKAQGDGYVAVDDPFTQVADGEDLPRSDVIISLGQFEAEGDRLLSEGRAVGVRIEPDEEVEALAYDLPGIQVDGNDILAVYAAAKEAVDRARSGQGPSMIECVTYRLLMHTTADDPKRYRNEEEVEQWKKRDPLIRFQNYLKDKGFLTDEKIEELESEIKSEIQAAVEHAEELMKKYSDPLHMFEHAYAEMPPYLKEQREQLEKELAEGRGKEEDHD